MSKFLTPLKNLFARIRYLLGRANKWILSEFRLVPAHWLWAAMGILIIMALFMVGMAIDFVGETHIGIFLLALLFFPGLALLAGLGVRFGIKLLTLIPEKQSWVFFGAFFFVASFFSLPDKTMILAVLILLLTGSFLGAGIYNLSGGRWSELNRVRRVLTLLFTTLGAGLFVFSAVVLPR